MKLIRIAPLGDPVEIELRGYRLTVRKTEADIIEFDNTSSADGPVPVSADGEKEGSQ